MIQEDYSESLRNRMVQRVAGSEGISANTLSKEVGISNQVYRVGFAKRVKPQI